MSAVKPKPILPKPMPVYPTLGSLTDVVAYAESLLPLADVNQLHNILYTYHNTLLKTIKESKDD